MEIPRLLMNKIECSILLSRTSVIEHLLFYTNSDTTHMNPFIQLYLATKTKCTFIQFIDKIYIFDNND